MNNYENIINMNYKPKYHKRMSLEERSAQFAPFAALTGYNDKIDDANILSDKKIVLDEDEIKNLNNKLIIINNNLSKNMIITITHYNNTNNHLKYIIKEGIIKKIDTIENIIIFKDNSKIRIEDIIDIKSNLF